MRAYLFTISIFFLGILTGYRLQSGKAEASLHKPDPGKAMPTPMELQMRVTCPGIRSVYSVQNIKP